MKNLTTLIIVVFLLISCREEITITTSKQPGTIVGTVLPKESIATIKLIQGEATSTTTTENGVFSFKDVEPGIYRVSIKADNFGKQEIENIKVEDGEGNDIGTIRLSKYPYPLTSTSPFDGKKNVSATSTEIRFIFSEEIDPSSLERGLSIEPNANILYSHFSSSNKYFYFNTEINFETEYKVTLDTSVTTIYGEPLEFPAVFTFKTNYFTLTKVDYPLINSSRYGNILLYFNGVLSENYEESITIEPVIPIMTSLSSGRYSRSGRAEYYGFSISPINGWVADTTFSVTISKNLEEINGTNLRNDTSITFTTPPLKISMTSPLNEQYFVDTSSAIRIEANYLLDQGTIQNAVSISPDVDYSIQTLIRFDQTFFYLLPTTALSSGTNYIVTVNKSLTDIYGVPLREDYSFSFTTQE